MISPPGRLALSGFECQPCPLHYEPMPIYDYLCVAGHRFDRLQSFSDDTLTECEVCGKSVQRVLHAPAVHFKGKGFYSTDYGSAKAGRKDGAEGGGGDSSSSNGDSGASKSDSASSGSESGASKSESGASKSETGSSAPAKSTPSSDSGTTKKSSKPE
jgi:putative FmdB family regulatory protein